MSIASTALYTRLKCLASPPRSSSRAAVPACGVRKHTSVSEMGVKQIHSSHTAAVYTLLRADPGVRVRDAPHSPYQVTTPRTRLSHPLHALLAPLPPPILLPVVVLSPSEPDGDPPSPPPRNVVPDADGWTCPGAGAPPGCVRAQRGRAVLRDFRRRARG